jgi:hypothetical protein
LAHLNFIEVLESFSIDLSFISDFSKRHDTTLKQYRDLEEEGDHS